MAGVALIYNDEFNQKRLHDHLAGMLKILNNEACEKTTIEIIDSVGLGNVSQGIFDYGFQPACNEEKNIFIILDGDIYATEINSLKQVLLKCDIPPKSDNYLDLLVQIYQKHSYDFPRFINGSFNIIIWDKANSRLIVTNDRYGSRPIYFCEAGGGLYLSTGIKALIPVACSKKVLNEEAIAEFFSFRHPLDTKTFFSGINILPPATLLSYQKGKLQLSNYWVPPLGEYDDLKAAPEYADHLIKLLRSSLDRHLDRKQSVGFSLSGGLDSRLLVGLVNKRYNPIYTFTRGIPGCSDDRFAKRVAQKLGAIHHFTEIKPNFLQHHANHGVWLTDGLMPCVDFYALNNAKEISKKVDMVCFGIPASPLQGNGLSYNFFYLDNKQLLDKLYAYRSIYIKDSMQSYIFSKDFYKRIKGVAKKNLGKIIAKSPFDQSHLKVEHYLLRDAGPRSSMNGPVLTRSQAETCFPLIDVDLFDFVCRVPQQLRIGKKLEILMFNRACPELAKIPWAYSCLPVSMSTQKMIRLQRALYRMRKELTLRTYGIIRPPLKREQANWPVWFRSTLRPWLEKILLSKRTLSRGYLNPKGVRRLIELHMSRRYDHTIQFGLLLTFELWNRIFIDGEIVTDWHRI